jgi:GH25 family lysozyme M1 (1,4-beta-N-acetylmuramidase)
MQGRSAGKVTGIDVSNNNGSINWEKVKKAGYKFAYIKASEGTNFKDTLFVSNVQKAKEAGIKTGAYHFARPSGSVEDGKEEADHFITMMNKAQTDLIPALDLEATKLNMDQTAEWVETFISHVKKSTGKNVIIYTGLWFMDRYPGLSKKLSKYPLWVSYYKESAPPDNGWDNWTIWQYTSKGDVPGISGNADLNVATSLEHLLVKKKEA